MKSLEEIVQERPYPDYAQWWPMGETFLRMMSDAMGHTLRTLRPRTPNLDRVQRLVTNYMQTVYDRDPAPLLVQRFAAGRNLDAIQSGEFDALSYGFFRAAFEWMERAADLMNAPVPQVRRNFAVRVGERFYAQLHEHLGLVLPAGLQSDADFVQLQTALDDVGRFLVDEGYLRSHFAFRFDVHAPQADPPIDQKPEDFVSRLAEKGLGFALYEMGYPAILPSAVYLYHTLGEAQHHSSRTIEELFARMGCQAAETDDFDPTGYPPEMVVELWEIRPALRRDQPSS